MSPEVQDQRWAPIMALPPALNLCAVAAAAAAAPLALSEALSRSAHWETPSHSGQASEDSYHQIYPRAFSCQPNGISFRLAGLPVSLPHFDPSALAASCLPRDEPTPSALSLGLYHTPGGSIVHVEGWRPRAPASPYTSPGSSHRGACGASLCRPRPVEAIEFGSLCVDTVTAALPEDARDNIRGGDPLGAPKGAAIADGNPRPLVVGHVTESILELAVRLPPGFNEASPAEAFMPVMWLAGEHERHYPRVLCWAGGAWGSMPRLLIEPPASLNRAGPGVVRIALEEYSPNCRREPISISNLVSVPILPQKVIDDLPIGPEAEDIIADLAAMLSLAAEGCGAAPRRPAASTASTAPLTRENTSTCSAASSVVSSALSGPAALVAALLGSPKPSAAFTRSHRGSSSSASSSSAPWSHRAAFPPEIMAACAAVEEYGWEMGVQRLSVLVAAIAGGRRMSAAASAGVSPGNAAPAAQTGGSQHVAGPHGGPHGSAGTVGPSCGTILTLGGNSRGSMDLQGYWTR